MAPKKAAKKTPKKSSKHRHEKHDSGEDMRRAYEHMGRLTALQGALSAATVKQVGTLTKMAEAHLLAGGGKSAAHLLRASEHLAFGALASTSRSSRLSKELEETIHAEYEHLIDKADEHWTDGDERSAKMTSIYEAMTNSADIAFRKGAFRRALEFARGAEAIAHVDDLEEPALGAGESPKWKKLNK
jgi:hypothetical protein